jgi:hypothetical protein
MDEILWLNDFCNAPKNESSKWRSKMKYVSGTPPTWKSKPKVSPLDHDAAFQKLLHKITSGTLKPNDGGAGIYLDHVEDGKRLGAKNPARMVRDHLNRKLEESGLAKEYDVTCRQTATEGEWAVWVTRLDRKNGH